MMMNDVEAHKVLLRVVKPFPVVSHIWFSAPYSGSEDITLLEGMLLNLTEHSELDESVRYEASVVDSRSWAPYLISSDTRHDKNFNYSYNFYLSRQQLEECCERISEKPTAIPNPLAFYRSVQGCLFGTAVGDAIGLPFEGMSLRRIAKFKPLPLRQRFFFGRGMLSDDTEHSCMVADALIDSVNDPDKFANNMAWSLRWWFWGLPAGIGLATLKSCVRLWFFIKPDKSGVFSAGNGPAMRSALLGAYAYDDVQLRKQLVAINTQITHTDPKALKGALIVAELTAHNTQGNPVTVENCLAVLNPVIDQDNELRSMLEQVVESVKQEQTTLEYCKQNNLHKGVSGYMYHTLPVVLHIVLRHNDDFEEAMNEAICCGGDTDTIAAITGGIVGARVGVEGIPAGWVENLRDWPRNRKYLQSLVDELVAVKWFQKPGRSQWMDPIRILMRNAFFMAWVLLHGLRRLLPPY